MKLIKALFVIIIVLVIGNVTLTNRTVDEGVVVANLSNEITRLQNENTIMKAQIAQAGSLGSLSEKIAEAGFVESAKVATLQSATSVASR